jgi:RHS repeat-associated protein
LPTRLVDDRDGMLLVRRDADGRQIERRATGDTVERFSYEDFAVDTVRDLRAASSNPARQGITRSLRHRQEHDALGRVVRQLDGAGSARRVEYDAAARPVRVWDGVGPDSPERFAGQVVNADGNLTEYLHDGLGRVIRVVTHLTVGGVGGGQPDGGPFNQQATVSMAFEYDEAGRLLSCTDQAGNRTEWEFDPDFGQSVATHYDKSAAAGNQRTTTRTTHDAAGRIETLTDPNGTRLRYSYDQAGRVIEVRAEVKGAGVEGSDALAFGYDGGARTAKDVTTGHECSLGFDSLGRLVAARAGGRAIASTYDGDGNRLSLEHSDGRRIDFERDRAGRLRVLRTGSAALASFDWLGQTRLLAMEYGGLTASYDYDALVGRLEGMRVDGLAGGARLDYTVRRDRAGRLTSRSLTPGAAPETRAWTYDSAGRVVEEVATAPGATVTITRDFDGDNVVRRETVTRAGGATETFDQDREERGRILSRGATPLRYDRNGNLIDDGSRQYAYDAWNRLVRVSGGGQPTVTYEYDALRRLSARATGGQREEYVYDGWELIEVWRGAAGGQLSLAERYIWGDTLDELLFAEIGGTRYAVVTGPEGSIDALVDDQGNLAQRYRYSLAGEATTSGALGPTPRCRFLFQGRALDAETGLYDFRMRWYHPALGQFLTPDPGGYAGGANYYALGRGDPLNTTDPFGMWDWPSWQDVKNGVKAAGGALVGIAETIPDAVIGTGKLFGNAVVGGTAKVLGADPNGYFGDAIRGREAIIDGFATLIEDPALIYKAPIASFNEAIDRGDAYSGGKQLGKTLFGLYLGGRSAITFGRKALGSGAAAEGAGAGTAGAATPEAIAARGVAADAAVANAPAAALEAETAALARAATVAEAPAAAQATAAVATDVAAGQSIEAAVAQAIRPPTPGYSMGPLRIVLGMTPKRSIQQIGSAARHTLTTSAGRKKALPKVLRLTEGEAAALEAQGVRLYGRRVFRTVGEADAVLRKAWRRLNNVNDPKIHAGHPADLALNEQLAALEARFGPALIRGLARNNPFARRFVQKMFEATPGSANSSAGAAARQIRQLITKDGVPIEIEGIEFIFR